MYYFHPFILFFPESEIFPRAPFISECLAHCHYKMTGRSQVLFTMSVRVGPVFRGYGVDRGSGTSFHVCDRYNILTCFEVLHVCLRSPNLGVNLTAETSVHLRIRKGAHLLV